MNSSFFISKKCHPQTIDVLLTRAKSLNISVVIGDEFTIQSDEDYFGILLQYPTTHGEIYNYKDLIQQLHTTDALTVISADLLALTLLQSPGELGADVAIGSAQRFGVPLGYGGPHAAYFATKDIYKRDIPGRLVGVSIDTKGKPALRLAMQTREQHIRREKATSNICTSQVLLANMASMFAVYHGPSGLRRIAQRIHNLTDILAQGLNELGYKIPINNFFDTILVPCDAGLIHQNAKNASINLRYLDDTQIAISLDETCVQKTVENLWKLFIKPEQKSEYQLPVELQRQSDFLTHPVFNNYHSETEIMRYLRKLADKDLALDRTMIPLGSCTMKLNAASEMQPITWPEFTDIHPFSPKEQTLGYQQLTHDLESMLCDVTGYDAVSLQPNAGSQGEYAGLLTIRAYHDSRGDSSRNICLIPSSAHGTNPATAHMAGMKVVVIECDKAGNVDFNDLQSKVLQYSQQIAALMITYPSTHGVFETHISDICQLVHQHGGQVYIDGANMNAMTGLCSPGLFGGDVSHLNLHKTFCIPHGGGGPGIGPIGVKAHLASFLPGHQHITGTNNPSGSVSAAPFGSASILPITWMYIRMMGSENLKKASQVAILNANYIACRLKEYYSILYTGTNNLVAHECIVDLRSIKESCGVTVNDIAKRLIDFGFHAPTMSFPVPGTLMIEPTESESQQELDRFCDAMIAINQEIQVIINGDIELSQSPLQHAPHTAEDLTDTWAHSYTRKQAVYPTGITTDKYWPPVGRINDAHGDRNLICSCPPINLYQNID
ncbi:UNVERIFIED_CONTAM: hypothetical protein GTU68_062065 [Idotea baltica]|nr:hypothetical protein [Idotea baltica]